MGRVISTKLVLENEEQYRRSLSNVNSTLAATKAELSSVKAESAGHANQLDALKAAQESLGKVQQALTEKVRLAKEALEATKEAQGKFAAKVTESNEKLERAKQALEAYKAAGSGSAAELKKLEDEVTRYEKDLATATEQNEEAQRAVNSWQVVLSSAKRELTNLNRQVDLNEKCLKEAKSSADGCATSIDKYGKRVKAAKEQTQEMNPALKTLSGALDKASTSLDKAGKKLSVGVTTPLVAAGTAAVKYSSDVEEAVNKVEVAFGSSGSRVKHWAEDTLNAIGLARGTALDMAALFGDMATSMGATDEQAAEMSITLVNLAADLASFKNISIDQANTALKAVFTGETESLKNLGVVMTETNLKAYALSEGYGKAYEKMSQLEKVQLRYQYVLSQTQNAQGDFARTFDNTANQLRVCQESLKEVAATAGDTLLPIITPMISRVNELLQHFDELDESTRRNIVQALLFAATLGPVLKVMGTLTGVVSSGVAAYGTLTAALKAKQAADVGATATQTGLNAAMAANPAGMLITAVGTLAAVLVSFAFTASLTAENTETLTDRLEESRREFEKTGEAVAKNNGETQEMVSALTALAETEGKTAAQKETLLELVEQLNEKVPGLSLAYDEQTDSLNMTTEALKAYALEQGKVAEKETVVERLTELYQEQAQIEEGLAKATATAAEAQAELDRMQAEGTKWSEKYGKTSYELADIIRDAEKQVKEYTDAQRDNQDQVGQLEGQYNDLTPAVEASGGALDEAGEAAEGATDRFQVLKDTLVDCKDACKLLGEAQKESADAGYLSLDMVEKLISSGLERYLEETAEGWRLTEGALEDYLASQRRQYELVYSDAENAAAQVVNTEAVKRAGLDATTSSIRAQLEATKALYRLKAEEAAEVYGENVMAAHSDPTYRRFNKLAGEAQKAISTLDEAQKKIDDFDRAAATMGRDYGGGSSSKKSGGSKSAEKTKTAAELNLEAWKAAVAELDHLRAMDLISEEEYYKRKGELADAHLAENQAERRAWDEELYSYNKQRAEKEAQEKAEALERAQKLKKDAYSKALDELDYLRDMDIVDEEEYWRKFLALRDRYLEEGSEAWKAATVKLYDHLKDTRDDSLKELESANEEERKARKDALDESLKEAQAGRDENLQQLKDWLKERQTVLKEGYKEEYEARKAAIDEELGQEQKRLNAKLSAIDDELTHRKRLREDEAQDDAVTAAQRRLSAAQAQRAYARTAEDAHEWDKEILRLQEALKEALQDKEDTAFEREKQAQKEVIQLQLTQAKEEAQQAKEAAKADYDAALKAIEDGRDAAMEELQGRYDRMVSDVESGYDRTAARLQEEYEAAVARLETEFDATVARLTVERESLLSAPAAPAGVLGLGLGPLSAAAAGAVQRAAGFAASYSQSTDSRSYSFAMNNYGAPMSEGRYLSSVRKMMEEMSR